MSFVSRTLCGVDEAGRGPLAGPVTAAAVVLPPTFPIQILADSKKLSAAKRIEARREIVRQAIWGVGWASPVEIDRLNILQASFLAMERAILSLADRPDDIIVDGSVVPTFRLITEIPIRVEPRADTRVPEVMAASILAKTARDWWMLHYSVLEPAYGYESHKGYPTPDHRSRLSELGPSRIQRFSFRT